MRFTPTAGKEIPKFEPVSVTVHLESPEELIEFYWRMNISTNNLQEIANRQVNQIGGPNMPGEKGNFPCQLKQITGFRHYLRDEIHNQGLHTTKKHLGGF